MKAIFQECEGFRTFVILCCLRKDEEWRRQGRARDGRGILELFMCCYSPMAMKAVLCISTKWKGTVKYGRYKMRQYFVFPPGMQDFSDRNWNNLLHSIIYYPSDAEMHLELVPNDVPTNSSYFAKQTYPMGKSQCNHNISIFHGESQNDSRGFLCRRFLWNSFYSFRKTDKTLCTTHWNRHRRRRQNGSQDSQAPLLPLGRLGGRKKKCSEEQRHSDVIV